MHTGTEQASLSVTEAKRARERADRHRQRGAQGGRRGAGRPVWATATEGAALRDRRHPAKRMTIRDVYEAHRQLALPYPCNNTVPNWMPGPHRSGGTHRQLQADGPFFPLSVLAQSFGPRRCR